MRPTLTISIPTWNRAKYLRGCLEAITRELQGCSAGEVEVLVLDNGSQDETPAVCAEFGSRLDGLRIIRREVNAGVIRNWLTAITEANGHWVQILGDDDEPTPGGTRILLDTIRRHLDASVLIFDMFPPMREYNLQEERRATAPEAIRQCFWHSGNAGVFAFRVDEARAVVASRPPGHRWTCWLQTEVLYSVAIRGASPRPVFLCAAAASSSPHHSINTAHTAFYLWHIFIRGLALTATNLRLVGLDEVAEAGFDYIAQPRRLLQVFSAIFRAFLLHDTSEQRKCARREMAATLSVPEWRVRAISALALVVTTRLALPLTNVLIRQVWRFKSGRDVTLQSRSRVPRAETKREYDASAWGL